jgi:serine/threonine-protein kinase GIN4
MSRAAEKLIRRMVAPNADVRCLAPEALDDPYWVPKEALKAVQKAAHRMPFGPTKLSASLTPLMFHTGKSASFSQAALSAINIDVDTSRLLDIVSPFTTRTLKERKSNKENITKTVPPAPVRNSDHKSEFVIVETSGVLKKVAVNAADRPSSLSLVAPLQKKKHVRSQSQPKAAVKSGSFFHFRIQHIP